MWANNKNPTVWKYFPYHYIVHQYPAFICSLYHHTYSIQLYILPIKNTNSDRIRSGWPNPEHSLQFCRGGCAGCRRRGVAAVKNPWEKILKSLECPWNAIWKIPWMITIGKCHGIICWRDYNVLTDITGLYWNGGFLDEELSPNSAIFKIFSGWWMITN